MKINKRDIIIFALISSLILLLILCMSHKCEDSNIPFESEKWKRCNPNTTKANGIDTYREKMLLKLIQKHKIHSLNKQQIYNLLGPSDLQTDTENIMAYWLDEEFKPFSVDILWTKYLYIKFDKKDGKVSSFEVIQDWDTIY